jgi:hypothetical protein
MKEHEQGHIRREIEPEVYYGEILPPVKYLSVADEQRLQEIRIELYNVTYNHYPQCIYTEPERPPEDLLEYSGWVVGRGLVFLAEDAPRLIAKWRQRRNGHSS